MLQTISDLFLLISDDGKKITNKDLSILYNFIIKKIPQIEQQYPSIILKSLDTSSQNNNSTGDKKKNNSNEYKDNKDSKKYFNHFQKQILNLFNDLLDYCYNECIIKLDDKFEKVIKGIEDKIREKTNNRKNINNNSKYNYNNIYQKEIYIKKAKKEEIRNFLICLIINGEINFNIYPNDYVNFFNSENRAKNRANAEQFMKFIKNIIIIYKENKKNINKRLINKSNNNTDKKINKNEIKNNNNKTADKYNKTNEKNNKTDEKHNKTDEKNNNKSKGKKSCIGIKNFNTDSKIHPINHKSSKINDKNIDRNILRNNKHKFTSDILKNKLINISNSENFNFKKPIIQENIINKKLNPLSDRSIIINNDISIDDNDDDEINDTIRCQTPKNIDKESFKENQKINLGKIFINNEQSQRRHSADKNTKVNNRLTISAIPSKNEKRLNSKESKKRDISEYNNNSSKRLSYSKNQKKNVINRNNNSPEIKYNQYHQSLLDDKYINNIKEKRNFIEDKNKPINKSQSIISREPFNKDTFNIDKIIKNNKYNCESVFNKKKEKKEDNKPDTIFNDKYNLVSKIRKDKNNNEFKELYLYKNLEVHQHLVIFKEDNKKDENKDDDDDARCVII